MKQLKKARDRQVVQRYARIIATAKPSVLTAIEKMLSTLERRWRKDAHETRLKSSAAVVLPLHRARLYPDNRGSG